MSENLNHLLPRLDALEARLTSLFYEIEYISEVPILREEYTQLSADLRLIQTGLGLSKTTRLLRNKWPHILVTYLSITAAYNENRGYWQAVVDNLDITSTQSIFSGNNHWGKLYLELLDKFNLDDFSDADLGFPYVMPIRLQGGIPRYSLPDFFEHIILPTVEKHVLACLDDESAFERVQQESSAKYSADKVIKLYMKNGGSAAEDFFSRCRKMARIAASGEPLPAPSQLELRPFVVQLFEDFLANRIEKKSGQRIYSPQLTFWPHQPAFSLVFPEQTIVESKAHNKYNWRLKVYLDDQLIKESLHSVRVYRKGQDVQTSSVEISLEQPNSKAMVDFGFLNGKSGKNEFHSIRSWPLRLLPAKELSQVVAFSGEGNPIRLSEGLPADYCWLLVPNGSEISTTGDASRLEQVDSYWQPWDQWQAELWDLSGAEIVQVAQNDHTKSLFPVIHPIPEPKLVGDNQITYSRVINDQPLFIGAPPKIEIHSDREINGNLTKFLQDWKVSVKSLGHTDPLLDQVYSLAGGEFAATQENGSVKVPLDGLIGNNPAGVYQLTLFHSDGKEFELPFRCWPLLEMRGLEPLILPNGEGGKSINLEFDLPPKTHLDPITDHHRTDRQPTVRSVIKKDTITTYQVEIPPGVTTGSFILTNSSGDNTIHVPLDICIPRLRWAINFGEIEGEQFDWQDTVIKETLPKIQQANLAQLYLGAELPKKSKYSITLGLNLPGENESFQVGEKKQISTYESRSKFSLDPFLDTINQYASEPLFDLVAVIEGENLKDSASIPVVRISRTIQVTNVWLDHTEDGKVSLHWNEPNPLRNRRAQIWNVWRPWEKPVEVKLPDVPSESDQSIGWFMFEFPVEDSSMQKGCYAVRFVAAPTWEKRPVPQFPPRGEIRLVQTGNPDERLAELFDLEKQDPSQTFAAHFERACIYEDIQDESKRDQEVSWCSSNAIQAQLTLLIRFYHWLEDLDPQTQKALRLRMARPDWLLNLFLQTKDSGLRQDYLRPLLEEGKLKPESAQIILEHADFPEMISLAISTLVEDESKLVVNYLLDQIQSGKFSVLGAFEVLKPKADFALFALLDLAESEHRSRLLHELSVYAEIPLLVYPGWWVRSDAGWGRIESIYEKETGTPKEYFRIDKETPVMQVTLRPGSDELPVDIDLSEGQIIFEDSVLYLCSHHTGCFRYITNDRERLIGIHNQAAHGGLQPCFRIINSNVYQMRQEINYSPHAPQNLDV